MTLETQQLILSATDRAWAELGRWLGVESFTHDDGIKLLRMWIHDRKVAPEVFLNFGASFFPELAQTASISPEQFVANLERVETREKFAAVVLAAPEPDSGKLQFVLDGLKSALPNLRQYFVQLTKGMPHHHRGGRPVELPDSEVRTQIREEIKRLRGPGVKLDDLYDRLAQRYGVSPTTIKRIRLEEEGGDSADPSQSDENSP